MFGVADFLQDHATKEPASWSTSTAPPAEACASVAPECPVQAGAQMPSSLSPRRWALICRESSGEQSSGTTSPDDTVFRESNPSTRATPGKSHRRKSSGDGMPYYSSSDKNSSSGALDGKQSYGREFHEDSVGAVSPFEFIPRRHSKRSVPQEDSMNHLGCRTSPPGQESAGSAAYQALEDQPASPLWFFTPTAHRNQHGEHQSQIANYQSGVLAGNNTGSTRFTTPQRDLQMDSRTANAMKHDVHWEDIRGARKGSHRVRASMDLPPARQGSDNEWVYNKRVSFEADRYVVTQKALGRSVSASNSIRESRWQQPLTPARSLEPSPRTRATPSFQHDDGLQDAGSHPDRCPASDSGSSNEDDSSSDNPHVHANNALILHCIAEHSQAAASGERNWATSSLYAKASACEEMGTHNPVEGAAPPAMAPNCGSGQRPRSRQGLPPHRDPSLPRHRCGELTHSRSASTPAKPPHGRASLQRSSTGEYQKQSTSPKDAFLRCTTYPVAQCGADVNEAPGHALGGGCTGLDSMLAALQQEGLYNPSGPVFNPCGELLPRRPKQWLPETVAAP
eukprot:jgi/Botrbrau1/18000/Bobra.0440s0003.1